MMRYNKRRSVVLLWFCLVSLPLAFFAGVISIEYQRMLIANRTANSLAESAATAASLQLVPNNPDSPDASSDRIDTTEGPKAVTRVLNAYSNAVVAGKAASVVNVTGSALSASCPAEPTTPCYKIAESTVTPAYPSYIEVLIPYTVTPAGFLSVARMMLGDASAKPFSGVGRGFAYVCVPGAHRDADLTVNGECAKPR
jgi:hypothetical protein